MLCKNRFSFSSSAIRFCNSLHFASQSICSPHIMYLAGICYILYNSTGTALAFHILQNHLVLQGRSHSNPAWVRLTLTTIAVIIQVIDPVILCLHSDSRECCQLAKLLVSFINICKDQFPLVKVSLHPIFKKGSYFLRYARGVILKCFLNTFWKCDWLEKHR